MLVIVEYPSRQRILHFLAEQVHPGFQYEILFETVMKFTQRKSKPDKDIQLPMRKKNKSKRIFNKSSTRLHIADAHALLD